MLQQTLADLSTADRNSFATAAGRRKMPRPARLLPVAWTAVASLVLVWRIRASMPRRSSANAAASSQRAASTAPAGVIASRSRAA
jgi:hypothetical protein